MHELAAQCSNHPTIAGQRALDTLHEAMRGNSSESCESLLPLFDEVIKKSPKNADILLKKAECLSSNGKYSEALQTCGKVISASGQRGTWGPTQARTKAALLSARMALEMGDPNASSKRLSIALRADPDCSAVKPLHKTFRSHQMS